MKRLTEKRESPLVMSMWAKDSQSLRIYNRLADIEDILGDEYDLDRLRVLCNQRMTMRDEMSERFSLTKDIPLDRLREIAEAERDGRCVVFPRLEPGHGDNPGAPGVPGPPGIVPEAALKAREQDE